jgi:tetratricopeptide (TPR) repeat protein
MIREKRTVYTLYITAMGILVLAPLMGTLHYASMGLWNIDYFMMTIGSYSGVLFGAAMISRNYLNGQYALLDSETKLGNQLFDMGRVPEAIPHYDTAISVGHHLFSNYFYDPESGALARLPPTYGVPWLRKGDALAKMGKGRKALAIYDILLELDPRAEVVWNRKGELLLSMGKLAAAIECFNEALKIVPTYDKALNNMRTANGALQDAMRVGQGLVKEQPGQQPPQQQPPPVMQAYPQPQTQMRYLNPQQYQGRR